MMKAILSILIALSILPFYAFDRSQNPKLYDEVLQIRNSDYSQFTQGSSGSSGSSGGSGPVEVTVSASHTQMAKDGNETSYSFTGYSDGSGSIVIKDFLTGKEINVLIPEGETLEVVPWDTYSLYKWEREDGSIVQVGFGETTSSFNINVGILRMNEKRGIMTLTEQYTSQTNNNSPLVRINSIVKSPIDPEYSDYIDTLKTLLE